MTGRFYFTVEADHGNGYRQVRARPVLSINTAVRIATTMRKKDGVHGVQIHRFNRDTGEYLQTIAWLDSYWRPKP